MDGPRHHITTSGQTTTPNHTLASNSTSRIAANEIFDFTAQDPIKPAESGNEPPSPTFDQFAPETPHDDISTNPDLTLEMDFHGEPGQAFDGSGQDLGLGDIGDYQQASIHNQNQSQISGATAQPQDLPTAGNPQTDDTASLYNNGIDNGPLPPDPHTDMHQLQKTKDVAVNAPSWNWTISDVTKAKAFLQADALDTIRKVSPEGEDDGDSESLFAADHAFNLFNAIVQDAPDADRSWDADKKKYYKGYQIRGMKSVKQLTSTSHGCLRGQSRCLIVMDELFKLHANGSLPSSKTAKFDGTLKASDRIKAVIKCVEIKHVGKAVLEGNSKTISDLVLDPIFLHKSRQDGSQSNSTKGVYVEAGKESLFGTPEDEDETSTDSTSPLSPAISNYTFTTPSTPQSLNAASSSSTDPPNGPAPSPSLRLTPPKRRRESKPRSVSKRNKKSKLSQVASADSHGEESSPESANSAIMGSEDFQRNNSDPQAPNPSFANHFSQPGSNGPAAQPHPDFSTNSGGDNEFHHDGGYVEDDVGTPSDPPQEPNDNFNIDPDLLNDPYYYGNGPYFQGEYQ